MYNDLIKLVKVTTTTDEIGQPITTEEEREVLCEVRSISSREFYAAAQTTYRPELKFILDHLDYEKENKVIYDGETYTIIRHYKTDGNEIELTCEKVIGSG